MKQEKIDCSWVKRRFDTYPEGILCTQENVMALAGTDGVELGFIAHWVYLMIIKFDIIRLESAAG